LAGFLSYLWKRDSGRLPQHGRPTIYNNGMFSLFPWASHQFITQKTRKRAKTISFAPIESFLEFVQIICTAGHLPLVQGDRSFPQWIADALTRKLELLLNKGTKANLEVKTAVVFVLYSSVHHSLTLIKALVTGLLLPVDVSGTKAQLSNRIASVLFSDPAKVQELRVEVASKEGMLYTHIKCPQNTYTHTKILHLYFT
jgi:hypothetical protein